MMPKQTATSESCCPPGRACCGRTPTTRSAVIVDDVLYTGRTVRAALDEIADFGRPARIALAVLIDRGGRELPIQPDVVGKTVVVEPGERVDVLVDDLDGRTAVILAPSSTTAAP